MALNFAGFPTQTYTGSPYSQPITIGRAPIIDTGPKVLRISIDWTTYGASAANQQIGVFCNLWAQGQTQGSALEAVRSIYIDNTYTGVPVYVVFPDSLYTVVCPAYSVVMAPVFSNVQQFTIYGDGFQDFQAPLTNLFFSNVDRQGFYIPAALTGRPTTPVILLPTETRSQNISGNFNLTDVNIGQEDTDRLIVCVVSYRNKTGANLRNISGLTMGGVGGVKAVEQFYAYGSIGVSTSSYVQIWYAKVPTGSVMNVAIDAPGSGTIPTSFSFYALRNLQTFIPFSTGANRTIGAPTSVSAVVQSKSNGVVIAGSHYASSLFTLTGATVSFTGNQIMDDAGQKWANGGALTNSDGQYTVTGITCGVTCAATFY